MELYEEVELTKVKLTRKEGVNVGLYTEYETGEAQGHAEITAQHHRPPHADLLARLNQLVPHLCFMCRSVAQVVDEGISFQWDNPYVESLLFAEQLHGRPEFFDYLVTGYSYDAKGGVVLIGQRQLSNRKTLNLIAPREDLEPEHETGLEHPYLSALRRALSACDEEVKLYLGGKSGPHVVQQELDFNEDDYNE